MTSTERDAWWFRAFLVGIAALGPFSLNVFSPCLPWIRAEFAVDLSTVQLSASLSILAAALATVLAGPLTDLHGRRPVLIASLSLYVAAGVLAALSPHVAVLIAGRSIQAATSSVAFVTARALIHDVYGDEASPRVIARVSFTTVLGVVAAPFVGGVLIDHVSWRAVFWCTSSVGLALLVLAQRRVVETAPARTQRSVSAGLSGVRELLRTPRFHGFAMQSALHFAIFFSFTMTASHLMVDRLGEGPTRYGVWFVLLSVAVGAGLATADRLSGRVPAATIAASGSAFVLVGACFSAYFLFDRVLTPAGLFVPVAVSAFGIGLAVPGTNAGVMQVRPDLSGTASGLMGFEQYVLAAIFAQLVAQGGSRVSEALAMTTLTGAAVAVAFGWLAFGRARALAFSR